MGPAEQKDPKRGEIEYARDILEYNNYIVRELKEIDYFDNKAMTTDDHYRYRLAVNSIKADTMTIRVAITHLSDKWRGEQPSVDWDGFRTVRNDMIHKYPSTEIEVILANARERLPLIVEAVHRRIRELESSKGVHAGVVPDDDGGGRSRNQNVSEPTPAPYNGPSRGLAMERRAGDEADE